MNDSLTIWCNASLSDEATQLLSRNLSPHRLVHSDLPTSNLNAAGPDQLLERAHIAFGQPDPQQVIDSPGIKWVHLTSAGYTRYDTQAFRAAMLARNGRLTNSSSVYAAPCAEHALAMVMALARQLPQAMDDQRQKRSWQYLPLREHSYLLEGQSMLIYGFGAIARRLVELLQPLGMKVTGVRRNAVGDEGVPIITPEAADAFLPATDQVMNILPASAHTEHFFNASRLARLSPTALFYNIGRGTTVDQEALTSLLANRLIAGAYLDVTTPEPLPPASPLWSLPNCWITPHTAGGHRNESVRLVNHFCQNLRRYNAGELLNDIVI